MTPKVRLKVFSGVLLTFMFLAQSCGGSTLVTPLPTTPASETATLTATETSQPTSTQNLTHYVEPFVSSPRLRFDSWSPDSRWAAYWLGNSDNAPAHLAFADVRSGTICEHEEVGIDDIYSGDVKWLEDNSALVMLADGSAFRGLPCGVLSVPPDFTPPNRGSILSPNGRYRADTTTEWEGELRHNTTTFIDVSSDQVVATVLWDGSPHFWSDFDWLNDEMFFIGPTVDQGVLYVTVPDGKTGDVMTDLLKLDERDITDSPQIFLHFDRDKNQFHLLVERWKYPSNLPLLLYHSELDTIERLSLDRAWHFNGSVFSPDGKWIFVGTVMDPDTIELWLHPVDPPGGAAIKIAEGAGLAGFSYESQKMAFLTRNSVQIFEFPAGKLLNQWRSTGYHIDRVWWSPDGRWLAMQAFSSGVNPEAIFVIEP